MTSLLPIPEQQFLDNNGVPLASGTVGCFIPGTTTAKATYQDAAGSILNTNPVVLDAAGRAIIYGSGQYRLIVSDQLGNVIYDQLSASTLAESAISSVMGPVVAASSLAVARNLMGIDAYVTSVAAGIALIPGPQGLSITGPTGPTGPAGSAGTGAYNRQVFGTNGTWTKPANGSLAILQCWGSGGAGTDATGGSGGGGGGYVSLTVPLTDLTATVAVTIGQGGVFVLGNAGPGAAGGDTVFGSYLLMKGGSGGSPFDADPASGYLAVANGLTIISGTYDRSSPVQFYDAYGTVASTVPFSGSAGSNGTASPLTIFGGRGGVGFGNNGAFPGGGGAVNGGSGASGQIIVTVI